MWRATWRSRLHAGTYSGIKIIVHHPVCSDCFPYHIFSFRRGMWSILCDIYENLLSPLCQVDIFILFSHLCYWAAEPSCWSSAPCVFIGVAPETTLSYFCVISISYSWFIWTLRLRSSGLRVDDEPVVFSSSSFASVLWAVPIPSSPNRPANASASLFYSMWAAPP